MSEGFGLNNPPTSRKDEVYQLQQRIEWLENTLSAEREAHAETKRERNEWYEKCGVEVRKTDTIRTLVEPHTGHRMFVVGMVDDAITNLERRLADATNATNTDYIGWLRYIGNPGYKRLSVCDSDSPGAFKVYRHAVPPDTFAESTAPGLVAQAVDRMHTAADDAEWVAAAQDLEEAIRQRAEAAEDLDLLKWIEETAPETMKAWRESYATQTRIRECLEGR